MFFKCMSKSGRRSTPCGRGVQQSEHSNSRASLRKPASQRFRYEQVAGIVYPVYASGKWIEITSGQPIKHGRDLWGSGADYGKTLNSRAPVWRAGANMTTQLKTEVPLVINGKTVAPGTCTLFIDLKSNH